MKQNSISLPLALSCFRSHLNIARLLSVFLLFSFIAYGQESPPQVTIIRPMNGSLFDGEKVRVDYIVSGTKPNFAKIFVDDRPVQLLNDVSIGQNTVIVDVPMRDCKISIVAQNEFGSSVAAVVNMRRNEHIFKPTLYILSIGVSKYNNPDIELLFAAKDAIDFALSMVQQQELLYESVELKLLTDNEANAENIRAGLHWLQSKTTYSDVAMLFMAGHGVNNNVGDFFYMPVNADINMLNATCVGYREIKETIDAIAGKTLVFIDACHSGNVLGNNQRQASMLNQAINDLTNAENGAVVFTSSTGRQFSLEKPEWDNGAFTKALVEGINGAADMFERRIITVNTLSSYVANRVRELTNGQQAPTTIIPSGVPDFPIAVVNVTINVNVTVLPTETSNTKDVNTVKDEVIVKKNKRQTPFYVAATLGASSFGSVFNENIEKAALNFCFDFAYFVIPQLAAGFKANFLGSNVNFDDHLSYYDMIIFYGPALYGCWAIRNFAFKTSLGFGRLNWSMANAVIDGKSLYDESYSSFGSVISLGANYMLTQHIGIGANLQSVFGSIEEERYPAGLGFNVGLNFRF